MPFLPDVIMIGSMPLAVGAVTGLLGVLLAYLLISRQQGDPAEIDGAHDLVINLLIGGLLTAKLLYVLQDPLSYVENPAALLIFPYGPVALPAGMLGGVALAAWGLRKAQNRLAVLDRTALPLAAGMALAAAGLKGPGLWLFTPLLVLAAAGAVVIGRRMPDARPGERFAATLALVACALVVADLGRPGTGLMAGISTLQLAAAAAGTGAWAWMKKTPGA